MPETNTLFVIICSNGKRSGGLEKYDNSATLAALLSPNVASDLLKVRRHVLGLIKQDSEKRDNVLLKDYQRYRGLVAGQDFDGPARGARYRPAAQRYAGSFYKAIGSDAAQVLLGSRHHVLILSGLYGLLRPEEPIQDYSCHIDDHPEIRPAWHDARQPTEALKAYVKTNNITQIFDFTALAGYRSMVNWNGIAQRVPNVWHAFGRQTVGDGLLTPLGELLGHWLRSADDSVVNSVASGTQSDAATDTDTIVFVRQDKPPESFPREPSRENQVAVYKDEIVRLARCLKYLLAREANNPSMEYPGADIQKLRRRGKLDSETATAMHKMIKLRNDVEHQTDAWVTADWLEDQRTYFRQVWRWAKKNDLHGHLQRECKEP